MYCSVHRLMCNHYSVIANQVQSSLTWSPMTYPGKFRRTKASEFYGWTVCNFNQGEKSSFKGWNDAAYSDHPSELFSSTDFSPGCHSIPVFSPTWYRHLPIQISLGVTFGCQILVESHDQISSWTVHLDILTNSKSRLQLICHEDRHYFGTPPT